MGIVKISEHMHENLRLASGALSRSINAQAEHWLRVGMLSELNPNLRYGEICQLLIQTERQLTDAVSVTAALSESAA
ncbi:ParD-like family protein [Uliginosibacterium sp. 31-16]|uniref:ParD-like family protein n=1 Tax=Uliginosibacterium sp. 31-16 TaxID=3068315 RepID=UPI00273FD060|nr:ParD-like family protein [Uliginosibacterium sp. 31-16]MDP5238123.1 ParD-like family protein [Uliginosibacterium sp. 31-16]